MVGQEKEYSCGSPQRQQMQVKIVGSREDTGEKTLAY